MDQQQPYVIIGLAEIYAEIVRLRAAVDLLVARNDETGKDVVDHEARLRSLERARWPLPSIAVLVSLAALALALLR